MQKSNYGFAARLLHRLALGSQTIARASFEIDRLASQAEPASEGKHVFIAGFARAGTTILLRVLLQAGRFCSLTYRNMPFVLMPNVWNRLSAAFYKQGSKTQRAHGDRLLVDFDSAEAFEEVFWRVFCGADYIFDDRLSAHEVNPETIRLFRQFVAQILHGTDHHMYLSKNNNNILRLNSIRRAFPNAVILVPFRKPRQQCASLLRQHLNFTVRQSEDRFTRDYMDWLGHHEFGVGHRPFRFPGTESATNGNADTHKIDYWLEQWVYAYRWALDSDSAGIQFVAYERLCRDADHVVTAVLNLAEQDAGDKPLTEELQSPKNQAVEILDQRLANEADLLYSDLLERSL